MSVNGWGRTGTKLGYLKQKYKEINSLEIEYPFPHSLTEAVAQ